MKDNKQFKVPSNYEFVKLQENFDTMKSVLLFIDIHLLDKDIIICTEEREIIFIIEKRNIPHLLGISYKGGAKALWKDYKRKRLNLGSVLIKQDGTTFQKLLALSSFEDLFFKSCYLTGSGKYEKLTFDASIRTNKLLLAIGLAFSESAQVYYPNTTLSLKSKIIPDGRKVCAIYTEDHKSGELVFLQREIGFQLDKE